MCGGLPVTGTTGARRETHRARVERSGEVVDEQRARGARESPVTGDEREAGALPRWLRRARPRAEASCAWRRASLPSARYRARVRKRRSRGAEEPIRHRDGGRAERVGAREQPAAQTAGTMQARSPASTASNTGSTAARIAGDGLAPAGTRAARCRRRTPPRRERCSWSVRRATVRAARRRMPERRRRTPREAGCRPSRGTRASCDRSPPLDALDEHRSGPDRYGHHPVSRLDAGGTSRGRSQDDGAVAADARRARLAPRPRRPCASRVPLVLSQLCCRSAPNLKLFVHSRGSRGSRREPERVSCGRPRKRGADEDCDPLQARGPTSPCRRASSSSSSTSSTGRLSATR